MNRRGFLGTIIGGVAATAAVRTWPFRVFSFPTDIVAPTIPATSIRFIRAYDTMQDQFISRLDVLYGFGQLLELPRAVDAAYSIQGINGGTLSEGDLQSFALRYTKGRFPVEALVPRIPSKSEHWIQEGWDVSNI